LTTSKFNVINKSFSFGYLNYYVRLDSLKAYYPFSLTYIASSSSNDNILRDPDGIASSVTISIPNYTNTNYNFAAYNYATNFDDSTNNYFTTDGVLTNGYGKNTFLTSQQQSRLQIAVRIVQNVTILIAFSVAQEILYYQMVLALLSLGIHCIII